MDESGARGSRKILDSRGDGDKCRTVRVVWEGWGRKRT